MEGLVQSPKIRAAIAGNGKHSASNNACKNSGPKTNGSVPVTPWYLFAIAVETVSVAASEKERVFGVGFRV